MSAPPLNRSQRLPRNEQHRKCDILAGPVLRWTIARFLVTALVLYVAFLLLWPVVSHSYNSAYVATAHTFFHSIGKEVDVRFTTIDTNDGRDVRMEVRNKRAGMMVPRHISSRYSGYALTALLIALTLATPLPLRRRRIALLIGLSALHIYIIGALLLTIMHILTRDGPVQLYDAPAVIDWTLRMIDHHVAASPTFSAAVPVIIWALATFRRGDLSRLLTPAAPAGAATTPPTEKLKQ